MRVALWVIVMLVAGFEVIDLFFNLNRASGAPQQAALAAMAAAWMIAAYVVARAAESIVTITREHRPAWTAPSISPEERAARESADKRHRKILKIVVVVGIVLALARWALELVYLIPTSWLR